MRTPPTSPVSGLLAAALALGLAAAPSAAPAQMFKECPVIGANTGCGALITIAQGGSFTITVDPSQGPYDGADDALIGVLNQSGQTLDALTLTASTDVFAFDGDGLCTYTRDITCTWAHPTGYEGPITSFTNINSGYRSATIVFDGGVADGGFTYFSLENSPANATRPPFGVTPILTGAPEPTTFGLLAAGLGLVGVARRKRRA